MNKEYVTTALKIAVIAVCAIVLSYTISIINFQTRFDKSQYMDGIVTYSASLSVALILSRIAVLKEYARATFSLIMSVLVVTFISVVCWGFSNDGLKIFHIGLDNLSLTFATLCNAWLTFRVLRLMKV